MLPPELLQLAADLQATYINQRAQAEEVTCSLSPAACDETKIVYVHDTINSTASLSPSADSVPSPSPSPEPIEINLNETINVSDDTDVNL